jgi:hypothetical protein
MAGRPKGSENKDKPFREALRLELASRGKDFKALRAIASGLIDRAATDNAAAREIADRLDGKPAQAVEVGGAGGGPVQVNITGSDGSLL